MNKLLSSCLEWWYLRSSNVVSHEPVPSTTRRVVINSFPHWSGCFHFPGNSRRPALNKIFTSLHSPFHQSSLRLAFGKLPHRRLVDVVIFLEHCSLSGRINANQYLFFEYKCKLKRNTIRFRNVYNSLLI